MTDRAVTLVAQYTVGLRHDRGEFALTTAAERAWEAVATVLKAEGAPLSAVQWVKVRPWCDYCERDATLYDRQSGDGTPLCGTCARSEYPVYADRRANTGKLGVTRLTVIEPEFWQDPAMSDEAVPV